MADELKPLSGLSAVPELKDDGSNWFDFHRRLEEVLTMNGYASTMKASEEPVKPPLPVRPADDAAPVEKTAYKAASEAYPDRLLKYKEKLALWDEKSIRACMAIRSKCGFNNVKKIESMKRAYQMIEKLHSGREMGSGRLIELTTRFYALHLADCESVADFSGQLQQINYSLKDLHPTTAFSDTQLVLRFLQGLGSGYDIWIQTLTQTTKFIATDDSPAITFDSVIQKAYDEEKRQSSNISGTNTALLAHSRSNQSSPSKSRRSSCTWCKKTNHPPDECFIKYPHKKAAWDEKKRAAAKKRKAENGDGKGDTKKAKGDSDSGSTSANSGETAMVMIPKDAMLIAIDDQVSGALAPPPTEDQAFSAPANTPLVNDWIVDTGCTNHATGTLGHFSSIKYGDLGNCGGIGGSVRFKGVGTVIIPVPGPNGETFNLHLSDVKYCPDMGPFNLISVSQLFKKTTPVLTKNSISWYVGKLKVNASAKQGLWILDRAQ
jgi:hypothetical protein